MGIAPQWIKKHSQRKKAVPIENGYNYQHRKDRAEYLKTHTWCEICTTHFADRLHHKDLNVANKDWSNYQALCERCHKLVHKNIDSAWAEMLKDHQHTKSEQSQTNNSSVKVDNYAHTRYIYEPDNCLGADADLDSGCIGDTSPWYIWGGIGGSEWHAHDPESFYGSYECYDGPCDLFSINAACSYSVYALGVPHTALYFGGFYIQWAYGGGTTCWQPVYDWFLSSPYAGEGCSYTGVPSTDGIGFAVWCDWTPPRMSSDVFYMVIRNTPDLCSPIGEFDFDCEDGVEPPVDHTEATNVTELSAGISFGTLSTGESIPITNRRVRMPVKLKKKCGCGSGVSRRFKK